MVSAFVVVTLAIYFCTPVSASGAWVLGVIVCTSLAMFALGLYDDLRGLGAKWKLAMQVAVASAAYSAAFRSSFSRILLPIPTCNWVSWVILPRFCGSWGSRDLIDLIDGIDGLAAGIGLMLMLLMTNLGRRTILGF